MTNPYLEVDKKIMAEVYTSSETMDNMKVLCDVHGSRFPGLPGDKDAVDYIVGKLKQYGCENVHAEEFIIPGWTRGPATLEITSPIKKSFDVISLPHSIGGDVEAELVFLGPAAPEEFEAEGLKDKIFMVTSERPAGMTRFYHRSEKYMRSVNAGAAGWIFMNHYPAYGPPTGGINPVIPAIGISYEDGAFIERLVERVGKVTARIVTTDKNVDTPTWNIIADVVPTNPVDDEYLCVGSHLDGHDISQGAVDPASGAAVVMEIARNLCMVKDKLKRRVRCMTFGAEEIGLYGSYYYADAHEAELEKCRFMLNLDAAGGAGKKGLNVHNFPSIQEKVIAWAKEMSADMPTKQGVSPYSDHWPFFLKSVPCATNSDPTATRTGRGYGHTRYDTLDKVDIANMRLAAANHGRILFRVANDMDWNPARKSKQEIEDFIKAQGYDKTVALADEMRLYIKDNYKNIHPETQEWIERGGAW